MIAGAGEGFAKALWTDRRSGGEAGARHRARRGGAGRLRLLGDPGRPRGRRRPEAARRCSSARRTTVGPLEVELVRRNIPFVKFGGLKFLDSAHVKDLLAVLRFAQNPADRLAGFRVLQLLPGIGPAAAERVLDAMAASPEPSWALAAVVPPKKAASDWPDFVALFTALREGQPGWPAELEAVRRWHDPHLERLHEDGAVRRADLMQLEQIATGYASRERFLTEITLDPPGATGGEAGAPHRDEDYLILSTIHSAKGQEWSRVYVLNCVDGCIPSDLGTGSPARDRRGAPAALRGDDPRQGCAAPRRPAPLLRPWPARPGRPARLRHANPLHSRSDPAELRIGRHGRWSWLVHMGVLRRAPFSSTTSRHACATCGGEPIHPCLAKAKSIDAT